LELPKSLRVIDVRQPEASYPSYPSASRQRFRLQRQQQHMGHLADIPVWELEQLE
jgi:hypothetical protein